MAKVKKKQRQLQQQYGTNLILDKFTLEQCLINIFEQRIRMHMEWVYEGPKIQNGIRQYIWCDEKSMLSYTCIYIGTQHDDLGSALSIYFKSNFNLVRYFLFHHCEFRKFVMLPTLCISCGIELWQTFKQWISYYYCTSYQTFRQFAMNTLLIMWPESRRDVPLIKQKPKQETKFVGLEMLIQPG